MPDPQDPTSAWTPVKTAAPPAGWTPVQETAVPTGGGASWQPQAAWRTNHPWLATGVDAVKGLGGMAADFGKSLLEQSPELAGAWAGSAAMGPLAAGAAAAFPPAAPVTVPAIEAAGAFTGAYMGRGAKYAGEKVGRAAGLSVPPPPASVADATSGMRSAGIEGATGSLFAGGLKVGRQLFGTGTLAQKWATAVTKSLGDVAPTAETAGKRAVAAATQQELQKKAPLIDAYNTVLQTADAAEMHHPIIGAQGAQGLDALTTRNLHDESSKLLSQARQLKPGLDRMNLMDQAARMKETVVERLNKYAPNAGDAYQHVNSLWHTMADTQMNNFITALKKDPSNAIDVFFNKTYPGVQTTIKAGLATARRGMDKDALIGLAQQAMPTAAWNDLKASVLDRALQLSSAGTTLRGSRLVNVINNRIGPDTFDTLFGPEVGQAFKSVARSLESIQGSTKFELAERFGAIGAAREVVQGKLSKALEAIAVPTLMRKASSAPAAYKLYRTIIGDMPQLAVSGPGQRFLAMLVQMAKPAEATGAIPPPPQAATTPAPQGVPAPPR